MSFTPNRRPVTHDTRPSEMQTGSSEPGRSTKSTSSIPGVTSRLPRMPMPFSDRLVTTPSPINIYLESIPEYIRRHCVVIRAIRRRSAWVAKVGMPVTCSIVRILMNPPVVRPLVTQHGRLHSDDCSLIASHSSRQFLAIASAPPVSVVEIERQTYIL